MYSSRERDACALCLRASVPKFRTGIQSCGALWSVALVPVCGHVLVQHPRCFQLFHFISLIWLLRFLCTRQRRVRVHQTAYERFLCDFAVGRAACSPLAPRRRRRCITPSAGRSHGRNPPESTRTHAWLAHYSASRHVCTHAHTTGAGAPLSAARRPVVRLGVAATPRHAPLTLPLVRGARAGSPWTDRRRRRGRPRRSDRSPRARRRARRGRRRPRRPSVPHRSARRRARG